VDRRAEPTAGDPRQERIAEPPVQRGHRAGQDDAAPRWESAALDQVEALPELGYEPRHVAEVVAIVGVAHDDERAPGGRDGAHEGVAVAPGRDVYDPRAEALGDGG
jgi:hypothetical protein